MKKYVFGKNIHKLFISKITCKDQNTVIGKHVTRGIKDRGMQVSKKRFFSSICDLIKNIILKQIINKIEKPIIKAIFEIQFVQNSKA